MNYEQIIMQIIVNGGDARSSALKAIRSARCKDFFEADELMKRANHSLTKAHKIQTELIQAESQGTKAELTLLMIHAQDHLMNAMTVRDLAVELIAGYKTQNDEDRR